MLFFNPILDRIKSLPYYKNTFTIITLFFSSLCLFIFYFQILGASNHYNADTAAHLRMITNPEGGAAGYSLLHFVVAILKNTVFRYCMAGEFDIFKIIFIMVVTGSVFAVCLILRDYLEEKYINSNPYVLDISVFFLVTVTALMITISPDFHLIAAAGTPNLWHNPTFIFCKPFALIVYIQFFSFYHKYSKERFNSNCIKEMILLSISACLCMWAKPSFLMSFLPSVAIYLTYELLKRKISVVFYIQVGIILGLSLFALVLTYLKVYEGADVNSYVIVSFATNWLHHSNGLPLPLSILLGAAFPLFVSVVLFKKLTVEHSLMLVNWVVAGVINLTFFETGERLFHSNFIWGYDYALFFLFLIGVEELIFKKSLLGACKIIGWILLILHLISGLYYFIKIFIGFDYF